MNADKQQRLRRIDGKLFYSRQFAQFASSSVSFLFYLHRSATHCNLSKFSQPAQIFSPSFSPSSSSSNSPISITRTRTTRRTILVAFPHSALIHRQTFKYICRGE